MFIVMLAPVFILFELVQLVLVERYIGIRQIRSGTHPLESERRPPEWVSALWLAFRLALWVYLAALMFSPWGGLQGMIMLTVTVLAMGLRRMAGLRWALVIMTLEGAIRMGMMVNLVVSVVFLR